MAQVGYLPIQLYRSSTPSAIPTVLNLEPGELAINIADKKLYAKDSSNVVFLLADASSGSPTAENLTGGAAGSLPYQLATGDTVFRAIGTASQILQVNSGATAPEWVSTSGTGSVVRATGATITNPTIVGNLNITGSITATVDISASAGTGTFGSLVVVNYNALIGYVTVGSGNSFNPTCTAVGFDALKGNLSGGTGNTAVGYYSGRGLTTGDQNTSVGNYALPVGTTGSGNTAIGSNALEAVTTGYSNTAVGAYAGATITNGYNNIYVGNSANASTIGVDYEIVIGPGLSGKGSQTTFIAGAVGAYNQKNQSSWDTISDERLKKNIVDNNIGLEVIKKIRVRNFEYRASGEIHDLPLKEAVERSGVQIGVIAQEFRNVLPESVIERGNGALSVSVDALIWHLINSVKQLSEKVSRLEAGQ